MSESGANIIPYQGKTQSTGSRGRPTMLDDPDKLELFAQALSEGESTKELAKLFLISERTVRIYKKDPRVKAAALKYIEDRVIRVTRKVDAQIEQRLENPEELDTDTLLKIRKEFLGGVLRLQTQGGKADSDTINEAMDAIESNPEFAKELQELLTKGK